MSPRDSQSASRLDPRTAPIFVESPPVVSAGEGKSRTVELTQSTLSSQGLCCVDRVFVLHLCNYLMGVDPLVGIEGDDMVLPGLDALQAIHVVGDDCALS